MKAKKGDIVHKLKIARGQLDGILQMVEENRYCVDISNQLLATQALLKSANQQILQAHIRSCVRDALLDRMPGDWDVTTSARPEETMALFAGRAVPTGLRHGTVTVKTEQGGVEITTLRRDGAYRDHRRPETVTFTDSLEEDLRRRDFTINAMAADLQGTLYDPLGGRADLTAKVLRCVGEPDRRFGEDALRILRGLRFAAELGVNFRITSGPALERAGDLAALLTNLEPGDVLFIDEIHRLPRTVEEILYPAMEDFAIDIINGKGQGAASIHLPLPRFTLIGATTRAGQLSAPLRDRFGVIFRLELYTPEELGEIVARSARILGIPCDHDGALEIASRCRGTPRIANRMLKRVRDFAQVMNNGEINAETAAKALDRLEVDELGLDMVDRRMLQAMIKHYGGGPVGLDTLAAVIGEEAVTIEDVYEPYLMQIGFISRTPRGRVVLPAAYQHLGIPYAGGAPGAGAVQMTFSD